MNERITFSKEEKYNTLSHGLGALFAVMGTIMLLVKNSGKSPYATFAILLYGISLISMFGVSATYHLSTNPWLKRKLRVLDHINIYFLIAGTYTPIALITLYNGNGWLIFYAIWGIALVGTLFKIFYTGKFEFLSLGLYLAMGWLIVLDFKNLLDSIPSLGVWLLFLGGGFYTFGILFYAWDRIPFNHFIWHIFVLGGATSHWFLMYLNVV
ncbi:PAQR family membrane homeostasis protein TrhA [Zobellia galactanivorans]|uniref:Hemolysin III n=1 Tax=Zobellia galactanivorans (strain DSM 12802 / CCUG 47099 / CIP 106680 / NCIMB 13871 / Dsij) TaxID=63186 RepID=G0LCT9_ZOBGA|nr:hemolysin III family protein [Zobellia galactanivorans]CAZ97187.1 Hemolysin III [Zobellia galactanivorans]